MAEQGNDRKLTDEEIARIGLMTDNELANLDAALLSRVGQLYTNVATVVAQEMQHPLVQQYALPEVFMAERVSGLVKARKLEAKGNLRKMRETEVRLASEDF